MHVATFVAVLFLIKIKTCLNICVYMQIYEFIYKYIRNINFAREKYRIMYIRKT